jgi:hypothetical protein
MRHHFLAAVFGFAAMSGWSIGHHPTLAEFEA